MSARASHFILSGRLDTQIYLPHGDVNLNENDFEYRAYKQQLSDCDSSHCHRIYIILEL